MTRTCLSIALMAASAMSLAGCSHKPTLNDLIQPARTQRCTTHVEPGPPAPPAPGTLQAAAAPAEEDTVDEDHCKLDGELLRCETLQISGPGAGEGTAFVTEERIDAQGDWSLNSGDDTMHTTIEPPYLYLSSDLTPHTWTSKYERVIRDGDRPEERIARTRTSTLTASSACADGVHLASVDVAGDVRRVADSDLCPDAALHMVYRSYRGERLERTITTTCVYVD